MTLNARVRKWASMEEGHVQIVSTRCVASIDVDYLALKYHVNRTYIWGKQRCGVFFGYMITLC